MKLNSNIPIPLGLPRDVLTEATTVEPEKHWLQLEETKEYQNKSEIRETTSSEFQER